MCVPAYWCGSRDAAAQSVITTFPSRIDHSHHMSTRQYADWSMNGSQRLGFGHRTMAPTRYAEPKRHDLQATGNVRAIQILLGHTKIENTVRYLGVDIEDALLLAERTEI